MFPSCAKLSYGGLLDRIIGGHEGAVHKVENYLDRLAGPVAGNCADAVRYALTYYKQTDVKAAAALDDRYPDPERHDDTEMDHNGHATADSVGGRFRDVAEPTDHYKEPPDYLVEFPFEPQPVVCVSPAAYGRAMIVEATELAASLGLGHRWDPYEEILEPITGDWNGLRKCKDIFDNVGDALGDMAGNLRIASDSVSGVWSGHAADGVIAYLTELARALDEAKEPIKTLGKSYKEAADGAFDLFNALGDALNDLIDAVIIFIIEASAAAATSGTVVGGIAFGAAAAYDAYECYVLVREAIHVRTLAEAGAEAFSSALHGFGMVDGDVALPELKETRPPLPGNQSMVGVPKMGNPAPPKISPANR